MFPFTCGGFVKRAKTEVSYHENNQNFEDIEAKKLIFGKTGSSKFRFPYDFVNSLLGLSNEVLLKPSPLFKFGGLKRPLQGVARS